MRKYLLMVLFFTTIVTDITAQTNGREIMEMVQKQERGTSTHILIKLDLIDKRENISTRILELYSKVNSEQKMNTMIIFHRPASVKNTRFLSIGHSNKVPEQWIYLPALKKTKRITTSDADQSFFGSDFTYSDMGGANIDKSSFSLLREETLNGIQCWVVESIPNNPHGSDYSKKISWISKEMIIPVYIEMFDREGKIIKKLTTENIEKIQGYWTPLVTRMENIQINHTTILTMDKIVYNENLPDSIFTSRFLQTGRP